MSKSDSTNGLGRWLINRLDIPADVVEGGLRAELRGRSTLTVNGCKRILEYTPSLIRLKVWRCVLCVRGTGLSCSSYFAGAVGIEGEIDSISFEDVGEDE